MKKLNLIDIVKKSVACVGIMCLTTLPSLAAVLSGTIVDNRAINNTIILTTNRASVYGIEITASANAVVNFYDIDNTNTPYYGTNYVNASYVSRASYATNVLGTFVGYNGYTNYTTNTGIYTYSVTNAANTNALTPLFSAVVAGNTYATYSVDALFVRGLVAVATAGTNVAIVINYRSGQ